MRDPAGIGGPALGAAATSAALLVVALHCQPAASRAHPPAVHLPTARPVAAVPPWADGALPVDSTTAVEMRNVDFHVAEGVVLRIRQLRGEMRSKDGGPIVFDDRDSFVLRLTSAEVGLTGADLSALMNRHVFGYKGAPLKRLRVSTRGSQIRQVGILHKVVDIPFDILADVSATPDGSIRIHPTHIEIFGVEGEGLMRALNTTLEKLLDVSKAKGVRVRGNDLLLDPDSLLPPPAIRGRVTAVRVDGDQLVQRFGTAGDSAGAARHSLAPPDSSAANYMFYRGGTLRFGKLSMADAEMQIVDLDPSDPFGFDLQHYTTQLVAGHSRTLPDLALEVFMPDIDDASRGERSLPVVGEAAHTARRRR
jgi:hypothetical protein